MAHESSRLRSRKPTHADKSPRMVGGDKSGRHRWRSEHRHEQPRRRDEVLPAALPVKSSKQQHPSSRETPKSKNQREGPRVFLEFGAWSFSGAWMLVLG